MSSQKDIDAQQERLQIYRRMLGAFLQQEADSDSVHVSPNIFNSIIKILRKQVRSKITSRLIPFWIYFDVKIHIKGVEDKIKCGGLVISDKYRLEKYNHVIEHVQYVINNIYTIPKFFHKELLSIDDEADFICKLFIEAYMKGTNNRDDSLIANFFPRNNPSLSNSKTNTSELRDNDSLGKFAKEVSYYIRCKKTNLANKRKLYSIIPLPLPIHYIWYFFTDVKVVINDTLFLSRKYGLRYNSDGEVRCFYNAMNIGLHFFLLHGRGYLSMKERLLVFALSAIHPAQDDFIDSVGYSKDDADIIVKAIKGEEVSTVPLSIRPIINLIEIVCKYFNPNTHPLFADICLALHKWQLISLKQQGKGVQLSDKELLTVSFMKGGYAFALYGYVSQGSMTISQFRHFFAMGAIFQIMDDLHDIDDDLENNVGTVFTKKINCGDVIDGEMHGLMAIQKCFEDKIPESVDFKYPVLIRFAELIAARYDIFRFYCMNRSRVSKEFNNRILDQFPFDIDELVEFFSGTREHETLRNYKTVLTEIENRIT